MHQDEAVVAVFATHGEADGAVEALAAKGFIMKHTSLIARYNNLEETTPEFDNLKGRVVQYKTVIKTDVVLVMALGRQAKVEPARGILVTTHPKQIEMHLLSSVGSVTRQPVSV